MLCNAVERNQGDSEILAIQRRQYGILLGATLFTGRTSLVTSLAGLAWYQASRVAEVCTSRQTVAVVDELLFLSRGWDPLGGTVYDTTVADRGFHLIANCSPTHSRSITYGKHEHVFLTCAR